MAEKTAAVERLVAPALVGRADELRRAVDAVMEPPALVLVEGEAGIGKTRLVNELGAIVKRKGLRVLPGRCHGIRESFPLGPVIDAVRQLGDDLAELELTPVAGALRPSLPELSDALPPAPEPLGDRVAERHRVFRGFVDVFAALGPTVLVLEDLHWSDEQTFDFVGYLLAESLPHLSVVVTFRNESVMPGIRAVTAKLPAGTSRTDISLPPLGVPEAGELAASIVGADTVSDEFAAYLRDRTAGLPFAIEELLALLRARGSLIQRRGGWARRTLDELDVPTKIRDSVLERVARLDQPARQVVEAAAVLQVPTPIPILVRTSVLDGEEALRAIDEALMSGVLAEHGEGVGFRHPLAAQAVYEEIASPRRHLLHGRAASELESGDPVPLGQVAHHLRQAGRLDEWVIAAERAAKQAFELSHDAEAVRLLTDVLQNAPGTAEQRGRLAVILGQSAIEAQRAHDVMDVLSDVLHEDLPSAIRGELRFQLGVLLHDAGTDLMRAHQMFTEAIEDLDHRPDLKAWAMVVLGIPMAGERDLTEHREWLYRALEVVPEINDSAFQVFLLGKVAMVQIPTGDSTWRSIAVSAEQKTNGLPRHRQEINAYWSIGTQATYAGHHETADRMLVAGLKGATYGDGPKMETRLERSLRAGIVLLRYCQGRWNGLADEAMPLVEELLGHPRARIDAQAALACLTLAGGELDAGQAALTEVVELADELGGFDLLPIPTAALLRLAVARDAAEPALELADRLFAAVEPKGVLAPAMRAVPAIVDAMVSAGKTSEATDVVDRYSRADALDLPMAPPALEHALGFIRLDDGRHEQAAGHFTAAAEMYEPLGCRYEAAQSRELAAVAMLAATRGAAASLGDPQADLLSALATYRELGATWDAGRATQVARRHGISVPAHHRGGRKSYGQSLSPREREVAELAAKGRSNKEIAAELYVSVNTVSRHITAVMRKVGVRSRAAIGHRLDQI